MNGLNRNPPVHYHRPQPSTEHEKCRE